MQWLPGPARAPFVVAVPAFVMLLTGMLLAPAASAQMPQATFADLSYGADPLETMDVYLTPAPGPTPVLVEFHPGGWSSGSKSQFDLYGGTIEKIHQQGVTVVSVNYPLAPVHTFPAQNLSCQRAIQFVRSQAQAWNIDVTKVGAIGISAGAHLALWAAMSPDAADPTSPDPVVQASSRLKFVIDIQGPTDLTSAYYQHDSAKVPGGSDVWQYYGVSSQAEFDAVPDVDKQLASPRWLVQNGAGTVANREVAYLGVYANFPTIQSSTQMATPEADLHSLLFGLIFLEEMKAVGAVDANVYISPYVAPENHLIPAADMIASWAHLHFTRSRTITSGFGVPGCIATQFQLCSGPAVTGDSTFKLQVYDCMPNWPGLTWVTDAADPNGGTDYYGIGLPLLISPFGNEFIGLDCFADANGIGTSFAPIPDNPILKDLTYYVQTACLWPEPQFLNGCLPSPLRISTSNLLKIVIQ